MRGSEWAPMYLLVVLAIAAVLLVTFVKPLFKQAATTAELAEQEARTASRSLVFLLFFPAPVFQRLLSRFLVLPSAWREN